MFDRNAEVLGKEARKAENVGSTLARLLRYFRPYTGLLAIIFLFVIINVLIQVAVPLLIGQTVDCALVEQLESSAESCRMSIMYRLTRPGDSACSVSSSPSRSAATYSVRSVPHKCFTSSQRSGIAFSINCEWTCFNTSTACHSATSRAIHQAM